MISNIVFREYEKQEKAPLVVMLKDFFCRILLQNITNIKSRVKVQTS